jgi:hypothetical protein
MPAHNFKHESSVFLCVCYCGFPGSVKFPLSSCDFEMENSSQQQNSAQEVKAATSNKASSSKSQMWLRDASLKRLNQSFRAKSESVLLDNVFENNDIDLTQVEASGLSASEVKCLELWRSGVLSGRHCMVALLECWRSQGKDSTPATAETPKNSKQQQAQNRDVFCIGGRKRRPEFGLLSSTIHLPEHFLCDSGFLYEQIFSRSFDAVTREAIKLMTTKAFEKSTEKLRVDQINLAIKQMRIDELCASDKTEDGADNNDENSSEANNSNSNSTSDQPYKDVPVEIKKFRLSILVELVRLNIKSNNQGAATSPTTVASAKDVDPRTVRSLQGTGLNGETDHDLRIIADEAGTSSVNAGVAGLDTRCLQQHLDIPLSQLAELAANQLPEDLEQGNNLLKPYIKQLSALKASLSAQLKDLDDTKAYLSLGLGTDASDGDIKRAYRSQAVKLHPDKPGGDTAKFQALQTNYQDIMNKRKASGLSDTLEKDIEGNETLRKETEQAQELVKTILEGLSQIKSSADYLASTAQTAIQWVKCIENQVDATHFPELLPTIHRMLRVGAEFGKGDTNGKKKKSKKKILLTTEALRVELIVVHLESVCDYMQKIASLAMQLPGCGFRFGVATAMHPR